MWKSKDDIIKDLAFLNDFGVPGDLEPYKVLHLNGREIRSKEKQCISEEFIDSRSGEVINGEDHLTYNNIYSSKGRGKVLLGYSAKEFQLQQQLRSARPLGSGDEAIETYCRRNKPCQNLTSTYDSEHDAKNQKASEVFSSVSVIKNRSPRVLAFRNSIVQSNALINGLTKTKGNLNAESILKKLNLITNFGDEVNNKIKKNSDDDDDDDDYVDYEC